MKLSEIVSTLTSLKETVSAWAADKTKATVDAISQFQGKLTSLEAGAVAELNSTTTLLATEQGKVTKLTTDLATATTSVTTLTGQISTAGSSIRQHLISIPGHDDYKDGGSKANASLPDLIEAHKNAVNTAMAATGVAPEKLPAAGGTGAVPAAKQKSYTEQCLAAKRK